MDNSDYQIYSRKRHDLSKRITDTAKAHGEEDNPNRESLHINPHEVRDLQDSLDAAISILTEGQLIQLTELLVEKEILPKEEDLSALNPVGYFHVLLRDLMYTHFSNAAVRQHSNTGRTDDWKYEVANGDTKLGYDEWLQHQKEMQSDENI